MASGSRLPTWKEREKNKRRERWRRAIAAKIFAGLRMYGNYKLPKHCDNNEVLKALCAEAGWTVDPDGTTYRKGCKPVERMDVVSGSASPSPCSSYQPSPCASYNPTPASSSFPSAASSSLVANTNDGANRKSLIPWLKNLSSSSLHTPGGPVSAPVTPPLSSPTARIRTDWDDVSAQQPSWCGGHYTFLPSSTPPSAGRQIIPNAGWLETGPSSPTFSLVSSYPFGILKEAASAGGSSIMGTPGQSGASSPLIPGGPRHTEVQMADGISDEFAFGSSGNDHLLVKPWEGERIHEELELTLGSSRTRADA